MAPKKLIRNMFGTKYPFKNIVGGVRLIKILWR